MKAAYLTAYGGPDVLAIRDIPAPVLAPHDVLIRQHASTVSPADCAMRSGNPALIRLFTGLTRPRQPVPGGAVAGVVEAVGAAVTRYRPGDRVFGTTDPHPNAMAELVALPEEGALALLPERASYADAAALSYSFLTAMPYLRDEAQLKPGQSILIHGAAGSIGVVAVQLARQMGAIVTATCSTHRLALVESLGPDRTIDRTAEDFTATSAAYDVIFDTVGKSSFAACREALKPGGIYLTTTPSLAIATNMLRGTQADGKRAKMATTGLRKTADKARDIELLRTMLAAGTLRAVIDRTYPLERIAEAHAYVETGTKAGDVVIEITPSLSA
ncbi:MAG: NAD(P)-dependent alcohol dehydrogenase [Hyphomicrobiales bacterium]|nr:MAG: NAD(P)-dependent alcohol dehydrogenase [Hyphomicrobiales bacterium]